MNKVNSLEEAHKHFFHNDAEGQVPPVICVKGEEEKEVASFAEAEAFYGTGAEEHKEEETKTDDGADKTDGTGSEETE